jgi:hypothetical protein
MERTAMLSEGEVIIPGGISGEAIVPGGISGEAIVPGGISGEAIGGADASSLLPKRKYLFLFFNSIKEVFRKKANRP